MGSKTAEDNIAMIARKAALTKNVGLGKQVSFQVVFKSHNRCGVADLRVSGARGSSPRSLQAGVRDGTMT